ncbi:FkbM family methyltransferase [uncultured Methanobrevibacter sp.]|uniref:FkbM family methyltransferase n=1 Tax=uncultured Methanobrevibacter sp. TaxID=253161 RepID=UPI0025D962F5|nr:FkbM family methyltransferase [uncultured Methanobrevibacter sp.]
MFQKVSYLIDYFKYIDNPFTALKFKFGFSKKCNLKIKNTNYYITLHNINSLNRLMNVIPTISNDKLNNFLKYIDDIDNDKKYVEINDLTFINIYNSNFQKNKQHDYSIHLEEFFTDDEWDMVNFSGRHVIDIGGNIGDTPLYFAKMGAEVISFEPVHHLYDLGVRNIELNEKYSDKIIFVNKGVGGKRGTITFNFETVKGYTDEKSYEMEIISIQDLLNDYDFTPDILKMDCEGCEFEVILNNDLTMFNDVIFEHHSKLVGKDYKSLINKLESEGFKTNIYSVAASRMNFEDIGIIHAFK